MNWNNTNKQTNEKKKYPLQRKEKKKQHKTKINSIDWYLSVSDKGLKYFRIGINE